MEEPERSPAEAQSANLPGAAENPSRQPAAATGSVPSGVPDRPASKRVGMAELRAENLRLQQLQGDLTLANRRYLGLFEMAPVGFLLLAVDGHVQEANLAAARLLGQPRALLGHSHVQTFVRHEDRRALESHLVQARQLQGAALSLQILQSDGQLVPVSIFSQPLLDDQGKALGLQMVILDIREHKQAEHELRQAKEHLQHLAHHDALTELPNRLLFNDRLKQALLMAHRRLNKVGLVYIDVDHFKRINDSLGHGAGDAFLREIAHRIRASVRDVDTVARIGGDEFSVVLERIGQLRHAQEVAGKILAALTTPIIIAEHELEVTVSLGIALYPDHAGDGEALIRAADRAMFKAKADGRNQVHSYSPELGAMQPGSENS